MSKQVLDIQQMQHLQELGLNLNHSFLCWIYVPILQKYELGIYHSEYKDKVISAYTLQDVLDALPIQIEIPLHPECGKCELRIKRMVFNTDKVMYAVVYEKSDYIDWFVLQSHKELIDAAYEMLCWAIEGGYISEK